MILHSKMSNISVSGMKTKKVPILYEVKKGSQGLDQALNSDGKELLSKDEFNSIHAKLQSLKSSISTDDSELIEKNIQELEKQSECYVERRMNSSIKSLIAGKGIDDIL